MQHGSVSQGLRLLIEGYDRYLHIHHLIDDGAPLACERVDLDQKETGDNPIIGSGKYGFLFLRTREAGGDIERALVRLTAPQPE